MIIFFLFLIFIAPINALDKLSEGKFSPDKFSKGVDIPKNVQENVPDISKNLKVPNQNGMDTKDALSKIKSEASVVTQGLHASVHTASHSAQVTPSSKETSVKKEIKDVTNADTNKNEEKPENKTPPPPTRTMILSERNKVCETLQENLCVNELCPAYCYNKYEKWHHDIEFKTKECISRCNDKELCAYTGMPKDDEPPLARQLRAQRITCMNEGEKNSTDAQKEEKNVDDLTEDDDDLDRNDQLNKQKHPWAKFDTPEFAPIHVNGLKVMEGKGAEK